MTHPSADKVLQERHELVGTWRKFFRSIANQIYANGYDRIDQPAHEYPSIPARR
jgi:hypothetical protein